MANLVWKDCYATRVEDNIIIKGTLDMFLQINSEGVFFYFNKGIKSKVDLDMVSKVVMCEPKLFKKGFIMFYGKDDKILKSDNGYSYLIEFKKSEIKEFYNVFSILRDNGIDVAAY